MKQHLNTLFITTDGTYLAKDGKAVAVRQKKKTILRIPLHNLDGIVCFGRIGFSSSLAAACAAANVTLSLLSPYGGFRAAVVGFTPGNVVLRRQQYRCADVPQASGQIARNVVMGKIANARTVLLRGSRDCGSADSAERLKQAAQQMIPAVNQLKRTDDLEAIRGYEGQCAQLYFSVFNDLISPSVKVPKFAARSRRPPLDPINALLSFLYAMLAHDARSACECVGLDAAVGFLHRDRPGRPSLALDLMEEFRPFLVDRLVLSLINRKQISSRDFVTSDSGAVHLKEDSRKQVLAAYQKRKQDTIEHPYLKEKTSLGLLVHLQARLLARHIRGDLDAYPAFIWK